MATPASRLEAPPLPRHIAVIMDGNGRWAASRGLPRIAGHQRGADAVRRVVEGCRDFGVRCLTLYAFSSENWKRPADEVEDLMALLRLYLRRELEKLTREGVCLRVIGDRKGLADDIQALIAEAEHATRDNDGLHLMVALNYGARNEIVAAVREIAVEVAAGRLRVDDIDEDLFTDRLDTAGLPDPDLVIRTSGEHRLSNFLLWQCAYAELVFTPTLWPDFGRADLEAAIQEYQQRERRYGGTGS